MHRGNGQQRTMSGLNLLDGKFKFLGVPDKAQHLRQQRLPLDGGLHAPGAALEQLDAKPRLKLVNLRLERGLRHVEPPRGVAQTLFLDDDGKQKELPHQAVVKAVEHVFSMKKTLLQRTKNSITDMF